MPEATACLSIVLPDGLAAAIATHGEETFPDECCGVLLGNETGGQRTVEQLLPIENEWDEGERRRRFLITPQAMMRAEREARKRGLDILGFYHSHPNAPARPSEFDREHAWPWYSYLIASIREGTFDVLTGWQLRDDRTAYDEVAITQSGADDHPTHGSHPATGHAPDAASDALGEDE
ncbi:MAG: M67 family metallopeptidase [Thermomicrobiales bacterium]|nr:M67 family metallopeptidase [Thermomicrobiales bacterium]